MTAVAAPSFFQSLTPDEVDRLCASLPHRQFAAGAQVLAEGEFATEMYVIRDGACGVFVKDSLGVDVQIGQVGPGATMGEMALFEGQAESINAAPATLRALSEVDVVTLDPPGFYALAAMFPQLLHNIGAILSHRLTRSYQHAVRAEHGRVSVLYADGGPPLLAYALACSIAWHCRASTVLVVVGNSPPPELHALASSDGDGARLLLVPPEEAYSPAVLEATIDELSHDYQNVVLLTGRSEADGPGPRSSTGRAVRLVDASGAGIAANRNGPPAITLRGWALGVRTLRPNADGVLNVPPLQPADHRALRGGWLPSTTPAGRALGWLARDLCGLKVGLALGAGSVRGYAHYGVLRVFERIGLHVDYIAGTSIGSIIASTYALGMSVDEAVANMEEVSSRAFRLTAPIHSLLSNAGVAGNFRAVSGDTRIEDLDVPLALVAADLQTGREVALRRGLLRVAALASMAIPGIYPPVRMGHYILVDGGIVNPVPISVTASMGADVVIAVSLGRPATEAMPDLEAVEERGKLPSLIHTITKSIDVMQSRIGSQSSAAADVLIQMDFASVPSVGLHSFNEGRPYIAPGEAAAEAALPAIVATLPWLA